MGPSFAPNRRHATRFETSPTLLLSSSAIMSSTIYNVRPCPPTSRARSPAPQHRQLQPTAPPAPVNVAVSVVPPGPGAPPPHHPGASAARLDECLETVRREFELASQDINTLRSQRDDYDGKSTSLPLASGPRHPLTRPQSPARSPSST